VDLLIAWKQQAAFDLTDELGVGQPEPVACGRTVQVGVLLAWNARHLLRSFLVALLRLAAEDAVLLPIQALHAAKLEGAGAAPRLCDGPFGLYAAIDQAVEALHALHPAELNELHLTLIARLEADRGACWDVQAHAKRPRPVEVERTINLEEVKVR